MSSWSLWSYLLLHPWVPPDLHGVNEGLFDAMDLLIDFIKQADQFLAFVGHLLPPEPFVHLPRITGRDLQKEDCKG